MADSALPSSASLLAVSDDLVLNNSITVFPSCITFWPCSEGSISAEIGRVDESRITYPTAVNDSLNGFVVVTFISVAVVVFFR